MPRQDRYTYLVALTVAFGGFLMGFDASVISGVVGFIEVEFALGEFRLGWAVASLTLTATLAMLVSGPLSDRFGRRAILLVAACLFAVSALLSALAPTFGWLVAARMIGGLGVGASLILAPMYIAEIAPRERRGRLVSFNQLNIVIGISVAFFSNYLIVVLGGSGAGWVSALGIDEEPWRWMLGVEALPAVAYLAALLFVPESPRWLAMRGRDREAGEVLERVGSDSARILAGIHESLANEVGRSAARIRDLFAPALRTALVIGMAIAVLQQVSGINAVFFYAPMIFELSGIGTDAAFMQAVLVGLVNLAFTVVAILLIDRLGRRPLLAAGCTGVVLSMFVLALSFGNATYHLDERSLAGLQEEREAISPLVGTVFESDIEFEAAVAGAIGQASYDRHKSALLASSARVNPPMILAGILGFVASFAMSLGPIMWVLFSELFPNRVRGLAVSCVGVVNSAVSFGVQLVFPFELSMLGASFTFLVYGLLVAIGGLFILHRLPETRGRSLEELEQVLGGRPVQARGYVHS